MNISALSSNLSHSNLYRVLLTIDHGFRYTTILVHLIFIIILIKSKSLKKRTKLYVNHATIVNCFYTLVMTMYIFFERPDTENQILNNVLCSISEIWWIFSSYVRMYSIFLIAIYRYLAVFRIDIFKKLNNSIVLLVGPIFIVWLLSIMFPIFFKFVLQTSPSRVFCLDGSTPIFTKTILYFIFNYNLIILLPSIIIVGIYIKIMIRIRANSKRVNINYMFNSSKNDISNSKNSSNQEKEEAQNLKKQQRFANQFILMCISVIASAFVLSIFSLRDIIPNFFIVFFYPRPLLRIYINCSVMIVPFLSMYYHPHRKIFFRKISYQN